MQIVGKCLVLIALASGSLHAQEQFFVFPQFADGYFADGTWYRSTIMIQSWLPSPAAQCTLRLNGMSANFPNASGSLFSFTVPADEQLPTATYRLVIDRKIPKSEAILALETVLALNQVGVAPLGDKFLKVVALSQVKTEAPDMITGSTPDPASTSQRK